MNPMNRLRGQSCGTVHIGWRDTFCQTDTLKLDCLEVSLSVCIIKEFNFVTFFKLFLSCPQRLFNFSLPTVWFVRLHSSAFMLQEGRVVCWECDSSAQVSLQADQLFTVLDYISPVLHPLAGISFDREFPFVCHMQPSCFNDYIHACSNIRCYMWIVSCNSCALLLKVSV